MKILEITTTKNLTEEQKNVITNHGFSLIKKNSMFGGDTALTIIGAVGAASITAITKIIIELIKAKASVEIEINGVKAKGISKETVEDILRKTITSD
ncbi:hypothetical protein GMMP15_230006 [Candidatus Magnetomoraceae bacterium gMMP-15]